MSIRKFLAAAALSAGLAAPATAAEPSARPTFAFASMKSTPAEAAKAKTEAFLKAANKFDPAAFNRVWADETRSVLDRTADAVALGIPDAAAMLADVRDPETPAPTAVPKYLEKDSTLDPFAKANLALVFAKAASKKVATKELTDPQGRKALKFVPAPAYEEAIAALNGIAPEQSVDPASYFFFKAVAEHATMKREAAVASISRLRDVSDSPHRYMQVGLLMLEDMFTWSPDPKDFGNIARLMDNSGRRLDLTRPDDLTRDYQKKIVFRLDELIKEKENQQKQQQQQAGGKPMPGGGSCPNPGPGQQPGPANGPPTNPAADSTLGGGPSGTGKTFDQNLAQYRKSWGTLPPQERQRIVEEMQRTAPKEFQQMIDSYFKTLNKSYNFPNP